MFKPISCVQTNVQPGFRRFVDPHFQPLIKAWRCELTGLSHAFNLYFIACNDSIYIYRPSFPNQSLSEEPDLILSPPISDPLLEPGIDLADPHSITRLHVDYLGREEILLVTCDDGDVIGYRVPEIHRVIENAQDSANEEGETNPVDEVRVFLHRNVGGSAWGIAVHRQARLIAIGANTHEITVFAYALSSSTDDSDEPQSPESEFLLSDEEDGDFPYPRRRDHIITMRAQHNIPSVFFNNNDGGKDEGRWLFSSSINGATHLWDLYYPRQPARILELGHCVSVQDPTSVPGPCRCPNRTSVPHAAWAAIFVDPSSCHLSESLAEACGPGFNSEGPTHVAPYFWDMTDFERRYSTRRSGPFPGSFGMPSAPNGASSDSSDNMLLSETEDSSNEDIDGEEVEDSSHASDQMSIDNEDEVDEFPAQPALNSNQVHAESEPLLQPSSHPQHQTQPDLDPESLFVPENAHHATITQFLGSDVDSAEEASDSSSELSDLSDLVQMIQAETATVLPLAPEPTAAPPKLPYCETSTSRRYKGAHHSPAPCIIVTKEEIYMLQQPFDPDGDRSQPILTMRDPLFPPTKDLRGGVFPVPSFHRHCFATQIPELGIFIVATPAGRVGIFSLTKVNQGHQGPLYAYRMDHLLPSSKKDGEDIVIEEVWGRRLIGVAVGPVQGMLDRVDDGEADEGGDRGDGVAESGGRRWRLMMCYHDHTVYSYELGKYRDAEAPGLGDLVV